MSRRPYAVGITGGIGAGKSVICKVFSTLGAPVYDADSRAKWLMTHSGQLRSEILRLFGPESFSSGTLDRAYIASRAFHQPGLLDQLNALVHPAVAADFDQWVTAHASVPYIIKEAALLIETGTYKDLDYLILVTAPAAVRLARVQARDTHRSTADIEAIMNKQLSDDEKITLADCILVNDGQSLMVPRILQLHEQFNAHVSAAT